MLLQIGLTLGISPQSHVISKDVRLVVLPVTVTDRERQFVEDLDRANFRVYEEGHLQTLTLFEHEDMPVTAGLVVDHSASMYARKVEVVEGAAAFVQSSNSHDEEFVVNFNDEVRLGLPPNVPFSSNVNDLKAALSTASAGGMTALYDAIEVAVEHLRRAHTEKKVLILITDGEDTASKHHFAEVLDMAQTFNVMIYGVGLFNDSEVSNKAFHRRTEQQRNFLWDEDKKVLTQLAEGTGGAAYFPNSLDEVRRVCRQIAADIRHQYTLGYSPTNDRRGGYRKIRVKVVGTNQKKLAVRTRAGYVFTTEPRFESIAHQE